MDFVPWLQQGTRRLNIIPLPFIALPIVTLYVTVFSSIAVTMASDYFLHGSSPGVWIWIGSIAFLWSGMSWQYVAHIKYFSETVPQQAFSALKSKLDNLNIFLIATVALIPILAAITSGARVLQSIVGGISVVCWIGATTWCLDKLKVIFLSRIYSTIFGPWPTHWQHRLWNFVISLSTFSLVSFFVFLYQSSSESSPNALVKICLWTTWHVIVAFVPMLLILGVASLLQIFSTQKPIYGSPVIETDGRRIPNLDQLGNSFKVAHWSDLHITAGETDSRIDGGPSVNKQLKRLIKLHFGKLAEVDVLLITGDMTDAGRAAEWKTFFFDIHAKLPPRARSARCWCPETTIST